ncbi:MAG: SDR family oxidoreductase [Nitrososphaeraceae archaeon]|nr:SDR family oxidoreductase [Nitrososphaeraceae archaeon]
MKLQNKVAIVTGASGTVGKDISKKLVSEGCKVVLVGKNSKKLNKLVQELGNKDNLLPLPSDITKEGDVLNIVEQTTNIFNTVDILVNNAGIINDPEPFHVTNEDQWMNLIEVNLVGTLHMTKSVLPIMMENKNGNIVNISSTLGTKAIPGVPLSIYGLTKGGLISFTKHISVEYGKYGIRCNCIVPSAIRSPYLEPYMSDENARKTLESSFPLGRIGDPIDVSNAVLYLCSEDSKWVTGTELNVDGGMTAK